MISAWSALGGVGTGLAVLAAVHQQVNLRALPVPPRTPPPVGAPVSVLVPARDEAHRIAPTVDRSMADHDDVGDVTPALLSVLLGSDRVESFLVEVARSASGVIEDALTCGVTVQATPGSRMLAATSDPFAARMDAIQYEIDDGPCLTALRTGTVVAVDDIATDPRWPAFSRRGRREGAASSLSVPLVVEERAIGALNLYAGRPGGITAEDRHRAQQFADRAAGAVALAARLVESEDSARHLTTALRSRSTIDQAIGVLMAQARISAATAFDLLRQRSQQTNTKLRDVARTVIEEITGQSVEQGSDPDS